MKRMILSAVLFLVVFIGTYLIVCFSIPGMRLKLDAEPREYFIACITHMVGFKAAVSAVAALVVGALPWVFRKKYKRISNITISRSRARRCLAPVSLFI